MISEFVRTIRAHLYERITSPLAGALIISWCLWNYSVLIVLFSSLSPSEKIDLIQASLVDYNRSAIGPFLTAVFFVFLYPFPARLVYWFTRKQKKALRDIRQKIEDEELLTKEESHNIRKEIYKIKFEHEQEMDSQSEEVNRLKALLTEKDNDIKRLTTVSNQKTDQLKDITDQLKDKDELLKNKEKRIIYLEKRLQNDVIHELIEQKELTVGGEVFLDTFDTDQGWDKFREGAVVLSQEIQTHSGNSCLKKINNNDPNGGFKKIGRKINLGFIFTGWIYRPSDLQGGANDRIAIEDENHNGYGFAVRHNAKSANIERRDNGTGAMIGQSVQFSPVQDEWYRFVLNTYPAGKILLYLYNLQNNIIASVDAKDSTYSEFDRVAIHGGNPYYVDDFRIITTQ